MAKREFLQQSHTYSAKHHIGGWFMSEKLDGWRCFWDGGVSRGRLKSDCPWANLDKDERYVTPQIATGLWTRLGNVIHAPSIWLDCLPPVALDMELYSPLLARQDLLSITKKLPDTRDVSDWFELVRGYCYDSPSLGAIFGDGTVAFSSMVKKQFNEIPEAKLGHCGARFASWNKVMVDKLSGNNVLLWHKQTELPYNQAEAMNMVEDHLLACRASGSEGLMLRNGESYWKPARVYDSLKVKVLEDMEVIIVGYRSGKITERGSQHRGKIGSLIVKDAWGTFDVCGLNSSERELQGDQIIGNYDISAYSEAYMNPGKEMPDWVTSNQFPRGKVITITYRGLTNDNVPMEARYLREYTQ